MPRDEYSTFYEFYITGLKMAILGGKKVARKKVYSLH
jgi:hypothetical protein